MPSVVNWWWCLFGQEGNNRPGCSSVDGGVCYVAVVVSWEAPSISIRPSGSSVVPLMPTMDVSPLRPLHIYQTITPSKSYKDFRPHMGYSKNILYLPLPPPPHQEARLHSCKCSPIGGAIGGEVPIDNPLQGVSTGARAAPQYDSERHGRAPELSRSSSIWFAPTWLTLAFGTYLAVLYFLWMLSFIKNRAGYG
ncbi:hypothetical protein HAX54_003625 [Datura stramonium]|uniref:Uncharacterized protein n=1 Tax=Datura stramonium TaxID=4076 RepID=A0ABS8T5M7_DATST|nr:hypothetical protein [Datura stramonium]